MDSINLDRLNKYVTDSKTTFENFLGNLIEIPTVSMDPAHKKDMLKGANLAASFLTKIGAQTEIVETPGHPLY